MDRVRQKGSSCRRASASSTRSWARQLLRRQKPGRRQAPLPCRQVLSVSHGFYPLSSKNNVMSCTVQPLVATAGSLGAAHRALTLDMRVMPRYSCRGAKGVIPLNIFSHYVICVQVADAAAAALKKADEQVERRTAVAERQLAGGRAALQKQKEMAAAALAEHKQTAAAVDAEVRTRLAAAVAGKLGEWGLQSKTCCSRATST